MIKKLKQSLRLKLTLTLMFIMIFTVLGSILITKLSIKTYFLGLLKYRMTQMYNNINTLFLDDDLSDDDITSALARIAADSDMTVFILRQDGTIYSNTNQESRMWTSMESLSNLLKSGKAEKDMTDFLDENGTGYYVFRQNYDDRIKTNFYDMTGVLSDGTLITMRSSVSRFNESVDSIMKYYVYVSVFLIFVGSFAMFIASKRFVRPIKEMSIVATNVAALDFDAKVNKNSDDEIGILADSINSMSKELEKTISELKTANANLTKDIEEKIQIDEMRKEFLSHVSHELKTPIALIQGYSEGLKECINDDEESRDFYCDVIMDEANKMNVMVKRLLSLNELEFGIDKINFDRFDIVELIHNINNSTEILQQENHVSISFNEEDSIPAWGDEFLLAEVYSNFITNAIHYADDHTNVRVWIDKIGDLIRVNVYDQGATIPEDELDKIWIKFYKVDKARTREYGGNGIGLSIVAATMKLHGQKYGAYNTEDGVVFYFEVEHATPVVNIENS